MKRCTTLILVAIGAAIACSGPASADSAYEIRQRIEQWADDFNNGRKEAACDLFSKRLKANVQGQGETDYAKRCELISRAIDDPDREFHYSVEIKEVGTDGDLGFVRLDWTLTITPGDVKSLEPGLDIFRREPDGVWRIVRFMSFEGE